MILIHEDVAFPALGRTIQGTPRGVPAASGAPPAELDPPGPPAMFGRPVRNSSSEVRPGGAVS